MKFDTPATDNPIDRLKHIGHATDRIEAAEAELPNGARAVMSRLMADAKPTHDNGYKVTLAERTLDAVLTEAKEVSQ